jgi:SPP1 family predicted phage head-tail adaptor
MRAGQARKVQVYRYAEAKDAYGEAVKTWALLFSTWAEVLPQTGTEVFRADKDVGVKSARFRLYYTDKIQLTDRLVFDGENYDIKYIREIGFKEDTEILAEVRQ